MNVLFLHQNFPAQFVHVMQTLRQRSGVNIVAITDRANKTPDLIPTRRYSVTQDDVGRPNQLAGSFSARVARGEKAGRTMLELREEGFTPDLVIGHMGWGETLFVKDVWPATKLIVHAEFYYGAEGSDVGFDPEFDGEPDPTLGFSVRAKNAATLMAVAEADYCVAPTWWQGSRFPKFLQSKIAIIHEGIDTDSAAPRPGVRFPVPGHDMVLDETDEVVTFVNRNLEPYRGYHIFMRALPAVLAARPKAHILIVGADGVSYGRPPPGGGSWKAKILDEVKDRLPMDRVHFLGQIPHASLLDLFRVSSAHVYLTYPFVLSWSMLEAMSVGALVIGSRTGPVQEVIRHGENGLLVDFFDTDGLAAAVIEVLRDRTAYDAIRTAARRTIVDRYDLRRLCLPKWMKLIELTVTCGR